MIYDVVVIGGGPAGLTAAIYAARAGRTVLVLEKESFGGQILYTPVVDNYPACAHISGMDLGNQMAQQAMDAGAELVSAEVTGILHAEGESFSVETDIGLYVGKSVILATGARHRHLGLPREDEFVGRGVSYCGVCDGAFYAGKKVAVVGGGNTALTNALFLAERCREVVIIHFFDEFQAESKLVEQVRSRTNISVLMVKETKGIIEREGNFAGLEIMDRVTEAKEEILCDGV
ncbi:MAG: FAD-dependent oxidoreductase, partial [Acidaminococcaceae bacterium]|nr:FAD-dependent oxidoreductase [Acidaminococcaceae bacterium]